jgi:hypothetical protein
MADDKNVIPVGNCPSCKKADLIQGEGQLDQSGQQYLPTTTWACSGGCGYKRWDKVPSGTKCLPYYPDPE